MTPLPSNCLNCGTPFGGEQSFCARCGQKTSTRRLTLHDIGHDLMHAFTHADHSVFSLVRSLAVHPGRVAREYVDGQRKKYFNPFTFLIIVVGIATLLMAATRFLTFGAVPTNPVSAFLQNHSNLIILGQVPLLAMFSLLLFRKERLHFAEHMVLTAYASGFRSIFFIVAVMPAWWLFKTPYNATVAVYIVLWIIYFGVASAQFYTGNRWWLWFKGVLVAVLTQLVTFAIIAGAFAVYYMKAGVRPGG